jgi:hypothetical protein
MVAKANKQAKHGFALVLDGIRDLTPEVLDRLYEAGCDDALISRSDGVVSMDFARVAPSLREAIASAIRDIESAGVGARIVRIEDATSNTESPANLVSEVGLLNSVLHAVTIIEMDPTLRPFILDRLRIPSAR